MQQNTWMQGEQIPLDVLISFLRGFNLISYLIYPTLSKRRLKQILCQAENLSAALDIPMILSIKIIGFTRQINL